jgi:hypothetical protein
MKKLSVAAAIIVGSCPSPAHQAGGTQARA